MSNKTLVLFNSISLTCMIFINYATNAGLFSPVTVGDISYKYDSLFAPAGYAFAIWGIIFLLLIAFVAFQWATINNGKYKKYVQQTGIWLTLSNIANMLWVYCWLNEMLGLSVVVIVCLLISLCVLTIKLRLELDDEPIKVILLVWWPIVIYLGWIMVATIACIAAWLVSNGFYGGEAGPKVYTIAMLIISTFIYLYLVKTRNLREAAVVGIWAFVAIAVRQWQANHNISVVALVCSAILFTAISIHGYKNRAYSIFSKLKQKE